MSSLSEIIYEEIEGTSGAYVWGKYGKFKVLIRKSDGYFNATKLCKDGGKKLYHWERCSDTLLMKLSARLRMSIPEILTSVSGRLRFTIVRDTYAHPELVPHIASWVSVEMAIKVSDIMNNFVVKEYLRNKKEQLDNLISEIELKKQNVQHEESYAIYFNHDRKYTHYIARSPTSKQVRYPDVREVVIFKPVQNVQKLVSEFVRRLRWRGATVEDRHQTINLAGTDITEQAMVEMAAQVFKEQYAYKSPERRCHPPGVKYFIAARPMERRG